MSGLPRRLSPPSRVGGPQHFSRWGRMCRASGTPRTPPVRRPPAAWALISPILSLPPREAHARPRLGVAVGRAGGSPLVAHLSHMWPTRARREGSIARPEVCFLAPRLVCTCAKRLGGTSTAKLGSGAVACVRAAPGALRSSHISHTCGRPVRGARAQSQPGTSASRRRVMLLCSGVLSTTVL